MSKAKYMGEYKLLTEFSNENAGMSEWSKAEKDGKTYFVKKLLKPVYPSSDLDLPEAQVEKRKKRFHKEMNRLQTMYNALKVNNTSGALVVPQEVRSYQLHICTVAEFIRGNYAPEEVYRLPKRDRVVLMRTLALALMNVHDAGYIHGDIKPDNVLIIHNERKKTYFLKLIDFDSSYPMSEIPEDMENMRGDIAYWAPEIYRKMRSNEVKLDYRIDLFALGVLFHYMWCGKLPGKPDDKTLGQHMAEGGKITLDESLPLVMKRLIGGLLEDDPVKRLTCRQAYDVLGVQMKQYPAESKKTEIKEAVVESAAAAGKDDKKTAVTVECRTVPGKLISKRQLDVLWGREIAVRAPVLEGYTVIGQSNIQVRVDDTGKCSRPHITFEYARKKNDFVSAIRWLAALVMLYLVVLMIAIGTACESGNWQDAMNYADMFPFYPQLFERQYAQIVENVGGSAVKSPYALKLNMGKSISLSGSEKRVMPFTAPSSGTYTFYSAGNMDVRAYLYDNADCQGSSLAYHDDIDAPGNLNFRISIYMSQGQTYYLRVYLSNTSQSGTTTIHVSK